MARTESDDFGDFLSRLTGETSGSNRQQQQAPRPVQKQPEPIEEDFEDDYDIDDPELEQEEEDDDMPEETNSLDSMSRALEYTKVVLSTIKTTFSSKEQNRVLKMLRDTINEILGDEAPEVRRVEIRSPAFAAPAFESKKQTQPQKKSQSPMMSAPTITEDVYNRMTTAQLEAFERGEYDPMSGQSVEPRQTQQKPAQRVNESKNRDYNKNLELGIKLGADGKPEVDLSAVSRQDIEDMKILAGL